MSLLTSAIKGLAGVAKSDALKEAERLLAPKPGFFSKLEEAITGLNFNKMPSQQLRKTMEGRQVSPLEYDNVLGQMEGTVSKEEVMNTISKNKTQFKDVTLGGDLPPFEEAIPNMSYAPKYERYSEPGYIPGSYRERFVTAPQKYSELTVEDAKKHYGISDADWNITSEEGRNMYLEDMIGSGAKPGWQDGHSAYSSIQNPVVRLRTNDRVIGGKPTDVSKLDFHEWIDYFRRDSWTDSEFLPQKERMALRKSIADEYAKRPMTEGGKKILFIEEMQGPSSSEQAKMPEFLRKRIYDTGVKKALMLAKEGGYDGVAWTPGEMQASRYDLSKQISELDWRYNPNLNEYYLKAVDKNGHTVLNKQGEGKGLFIKDLENTVGKEIVAKIQRDVDRGLNQRTLSGLDLKVGGEGLKYLYDKQLPSLFKKYGKEEVKSVAISKELKPKEVQFEDLPIHIQDMEGAIREEVEGSPEHLKLLDDFYAALKKHDIRVEESDGVMGDVELKYFKNKVDKEDIKVPYIPITQKTPSRHPVYSFIPPTLAGMTAMYRTGEQNAQ